MTDPLQDPLSGGDEEFEEQPPEAEEDDAEELEDQDEAAADAAASEDAEGGPGEGRKAAAAGTLSTTTKAVALDPQARDGLIRCLQARIKELDATLAHATDVALKDSFYSRWPNVVTELRTQALKRLEELQRS